MPVDQHEWLNPVTPPEWLNSPVTQAMVRAEEELYEEEKAAQIAACKRAIRLSHSTTWGQTFWTIDPRQLTEAAEWLNKQVQLVNKELNDG